MEVVGIQKVKGAAWRFLMTNLRVVRAISVAPHSYPNVLHVTATLCVYICTGYVMCKSFSLQ